MRQEQDAPRTGLRKLGSNVLIFSIGSFAAKLMGYFLLPFYTHVLSHAEYGIYDIVITTANLLFPLFTLLITESTMRFALDKTCDERKVFTLSALVVSVGLLFSLALSPLILLSENYRPYYLFFVLYYIFSTVHTLSAQFAKGREQTKDFAVSGIIAAAVTVLLNILLLAVWQWGLTGYFIASFAGFFVSSLYLWFRCHLFRAICRVRRDDLPLLREMLRYSVPIMPNSISWWVSTSSDKYIIDYTHGAAETGLYAAAYKIPSLMTVFTSVFLGAWQISAVEDFGTEHSKELFAKVYRSFFAFLLAASAAVIAFSKLATKIIFAEKFYAAWAFVPLLVLAYLFHDLAAFTGSVYTAAKKTKMLFWSTVVGALVNIGLNLWLIPRYGALGGAFTTFVSYFLVWLIRLFDSRELLRLPYRVLWDSVSLFLILCLTAVVTWDGPHALLIGIGIFLLIVAIQAKALFTLCKDVLHGLKKRKG